MQPTINRQKPRILVVDDHSAIRQLLVQVLQEEGYDTDDAGDGHEALRHMARRQPDLIVLDMMMPGMDGCTFLQELRKQGPGATIPVIAMSAADSMLAQAVQLGVQNHLKKPFELNVLLNAIGMLLRPWPEHPFTASQLTMA